jgi:small-conductance mechanosensitive channel
MRQAVAARASPGWRAWLSRVMPVALIALALALIAPAHAADPDDAAAEAAGPATLRLLNRDIVTLRATVAGASPQRRVEQARERIRQLPDSAMDQPLQVLPFELGKLHGRQFLLGDANLFALYDTDLEPDGRRDLDALARHTRERLEEAGRAWHETRDGPLLMRGLALTALACAVLALLVWGILVLGRRVVGWLESTRSRIAAHSTGIDWREILARLLMGSITLLKWVLIALLAYVWLRLVLAAFVATQPLAIALDGWLYRKLVWIVSGAAEGLPGLATVIIVLLLTRALADVLAYVFGAVQQGRLTLPFLHRDTISATRRIVTVLVWGLGIAIAYPYLPGSGSEAFKGLSVLAGLMLTLGSSGLVMQAMSGLVVIYSRSLRKGDYIEVNGTQGVVTEISSLAIKLVDIRNEEITIPNAVLVSSPIRNYSRLAHAEGTLLVTRLTIGYDAPWRQVHAMLEEAARRTPGVLNLPAPYVYQRALSDFFVEYALHASVRHAAERPAIQSALHAAIQDVFNENGVQIMSPHFLAQPAQPVVVPPPDWFRPPARPPSS